MKPDILPPPCTRPPSPGWSRSAPSGPTAQRPTPWATVAAVGGLLVAALAPAGALGAEIGGHIYADVNGNATSAQVQLSHAPDHGLSAVPVRLWGPREIKEAATDRRGAFSFDGVSDGTWLWSAELPGPVTSHNAPKRLPVAVEEGRVNLVAFGDSNGVAGSSRPYPVRLRDHLLGLTDARLTNISISGSEAAEWVPGTPYFDDRLAPLVPTADVITFTLGGNDLVHYWGGLPPDLSDLAGFPAAYQEIKADLVAIVEGINAIKADVDVVYIVYPNFMNSAIWQEAIGEPWPLARLGGWAIFADWRRHLSDALPDLILADVLAAGDPSVLLDPWLADGFHPNDAGHQWYADVCFEALGGVVVGDESLGERREIAVSPR